MGPEVASLVLLRACGVNQQQFRQLTQQWQNRLPATEDQLQTLLVSLRRLGHIVEHFPGNVAGTLHGGTRSFFGDDAWNADPNQAYFQGGATTSGDQWGAQASGQPLDPAWAWQNAEAFPVETADNYTSEDTETESDDGADLDFSEINALPTQPERDEFAYWQ